MAGHYILTLASNDELGVTRKVAEAIRAVGGSWLKSRLASLQGKYVGIIHIMLPSEDQLEAFQAHLESLGDSHILVECERLRLPAESVPARQQAAFHASGADRLGIVLELTEAFSERQINVAELESDCSSMPYSGEPIFTVHGILELPEGLDFDELVDEFDRISEKLGIDVELNHLEP